MEVFVKFFRDTLSGFYYFIYALILLFFIFAIIGYFVSEKYMASTPMKKKKVLTSQPQATQNAQTQVNQQQASTVQQVK